MGTYGAFGTLGTLGQGLANPLDQYGSATNPNASNGSPFGAPGTLGGMPMAASSHEAPAAGGMPMMSASSYEPPAQGGPAMSASSYEPSAAASASSAPMGAPAPNAPGNVFRPQGYGFRHGMGMPRGYGGNAFGMMYGAQQHSGAPGNGYGYWSRLANIGGA